MVNICEWELENQLQFASIVVNGLVAAGTIAAVVVAICANKQTKKALCQSKNIELLDKRIDILEKIKNDEDVSENIVNLMFSEHEKELFQIMTENKRKKIRLTIERIHISSFCLKSKMTLISMMIYINVF